MATNDERHRLIQRCVMRRPEAAAEDSVALWQRLAAELGAIIGEGAFQALFARSVHMARASYPWLADGANDAFAALRASLGLHPAQTGAASIALFTIFTDTLILLIGATLTTAILRSAWKQDLADTAAKGIEL